MQSLLINQSFNKIVESCPHSESNPQCPFETFRNLKNMGFPGVTDVCSLPDKELMLSYHSVCNKIRTSNLKISKAG